MMPKHALIAAAAVVLGGLFAGVPSVPQAAEVQHPVPPYALVEHARLLRELDGLAQRPGQLGVAGAHLREAVRAHLSYREEVVLPVFGLLPRIAEGEATPDMAWAVALGDRVRRERQENLLVHIDITDRLIAVFTVAQQVGDEAAVREAQDLAAFMQGDAEQDENVAVVVANLVRARLPAGG